ncbi:MAG: hypothetical protein KC656_15690, partial [Myxococcales bacterium]|nr:hypothetical protein [Myxococcales bacterium]
MRHDILSIYRVSPHGSPRDALPVAGRLGEVWYAGFRHTLAPQPSLASAPWCQIVAVPAGELDGVEDRLIVADAELSRHGLAWVLDAPANRGNVFVRLVRSLGVLDRMVGAFGEHATVALGARVLRPLSARPALQ